MPTQTPTVRPTLTRRTALLLALAIPMGSWRGLKAQARSTEPGAFGSKLPVGKAHLTVDLDNWTGITFALGEDRVTYTGRDIFNALRRKDT